MTGSGFTLDKTELLDDKNLLPSNLHFIELQESGIRVPEIFAVSKSAYEQFIKENNLKIKIKHLLETVNYENPQSLMQVSEIIKNLILKSDISQKLAKEVAAKYKKMGSLFNSASVSVIINFPYNRYPNIAGDANLLLAIKESWALSFNPEYLGKEDISPFVIIQREVRSKACGICITDSLNTQDKSSMIISSATDLTPAKLEQIQNACTKIDKFYYFPQEVEWCIDKNKFYVLGVKPASVLDKAPFIKGENTAPGIATGKIKVVNNEKDIKNVKKDIPFINSQELLEASLIKSCAAVIIANSTKNQAVENKIKKAGIPAVAGIGNGANKLKDGMIVTVNGSKGTISKGGLNSKSSFITNTFGLKTATKIYIDLKNSDDTTKPSLKTVEGAILNLEHIISKMGYHPKSTIKTKGEKHYVDKIKETIVKSAKAFYPRPVIYKASNFTSGEYLNLLEGKLFENREDNPKIGFRGSLRSIYDPKLFELELEAIKIARNKENCKNVWLMIPFVRTAKELQEIKKIISSANLHRSSSFKIWMGAEVPSNAVLTSGFLEQGLDGVCVDLDMLNTLMLGLDFDNIEIPYSFEQYTEALTWAVKSIIDASKKYRTLSCVIIKNNLSDELLDLLVTLGTEAVSVSEDKVDLARQIISEKESKLIKRLEKA